MTFGVPVRWAIGRRHRIQAARVQGMAAQHPARGKPAALDRAEARNGFHRVNRAGGMEAAGGSQQRAEPAFVASQHQDKEAIYHDSFMPAGSYLAAMHREHWFAPVS